MRPLDQKGAGLCAALRRLQRPQELDARIRGARDRGHGETLLSAQTCFGQARRTPAKSAPRTSAEDAAASRRAWRRYERACNARRALATNAPNAAGSVTARSARIFRSTSMPASCRPWMKWLYFRSCMCVAALMRVIHSRRMSRLRLRRAPRAQAGGVLIDSRAGVVGPPPAPHGAPRGVMALFLLLFGVTPPLSPALPILPQL